MIRRMIALFLSILLLIPALALPASASDWAAPAMTFAYDAGIVPPVADVAAPATRAEFAYMVTELLGLQASAALWEFPDVSPMHPYAEALGRAVELGLLNGIDGLLCPDQPVTREQAFVILSRAFALDDGDPISLQRFGDGRLVGDWAAKATAGLVEMGLVQGSDGLLRPQDSVSIQELAQLLLNLTRRVYDGDGGTAIVPAGGMLPADAAIDGDLYLCCSDEITLTDVSVSGRLVIRGSGKVTLDDVSADSITLCDDGAVLYTEGDGEIIARGAVTIHGGADALTAVDGTVLADGDYAQLYCDSGTVTLEEDAFAEEATLRSENVVLTGAGEAEYVTITAPNCAVLVETDELIEDIPPEPVVPATVIETIEVQAVVNTGIGYFADEHLKEYLGWLSEGTTGTYTNYYTGVSAQLTLPDGTAVWVPWYALDISEDNYVRPYDYTTEEKENYVNQAGYASETPYLVWVSLKCQRVNVFLGSAGQWKLIQTFICASGKNTTPTIAGVFAYTIRHDHWDFGDYYVKPVLVFNGGHAFHSRTYTPSGNLLDARLSMTVSAGCIRMYDEDVNWLDQYLPLKSTVVVY